MLISKSFPREVGPPRKLVGNIKEWLKYVNTNNGKKNAVYTSIYSFKEINDDGRKLKPVYESANLDLIFFDMDDKECNAWEEANKLHKECLKNDYKHTIVMSGRGYHFYIYCEKYNPKFIKSTIYNAQMKFINKLKVKVDRQVIGNPAQLARVPNTYNIRGRRYCIPLTQEDFEKGDEHCKKLAYKQQFIKDKSIIGDVLLDLKEFDNEVWDEADNMIFMQNIEIPSSENIDLKNIPPCIKYIMSKENAGYKERGIVILYFKERGYNKQEIYNILKQFLSIKKFKHCIVEEKQLQYLYDERDDLVFPSCETLRKMGLCQNYVEDCEFFKNQNIYKV